jgi:hypothetical protein
MDMDTDKDIKSWEFSVRIFIRRSSPTSSVWIAFDRSWHNFQLHHILVAFHDKKNDMQIFKKIELPLGMLSK